MDWWGSVVKPFFQNERREFARRPIQRCGTISDRDDDFIAYMRAEGSSVFGSAHAVEDTVLDSP
ncbi:MAG TPA: hypothetical protein VFB55_05940, partial [Verrucomicrobiae bacterium]|nr:hypothetical protein [Verrucomicrobiae bacterium]